MTESAAQPTGKEPEPENTSPPAAVATNEQEPEPVDGTDEEQSVAASEPSPSSAASKVFQSSQQLFQRLSLQARDAAVVAGQKLDQAALSLGAAVDNYAIQVLLQSSGDHHTREFPCCKHRCGMHIHTHASHTIVSYHTPAPVLVPYARCALALGVLGLA